MIARLSFVTLILLTLVSGAAAFDSAVTFQGELRDAGVPLDGSVDLQVAAWDQPVGGVLVASDEFVDVEVVDGVFTVQLEFDADVYDGGALWLAVTARAPHDPLDALPFTFLEPRIELLPVAYANFATRSADWERVGSSLVNSNGGFVGINRSTPNPGEVFGVGSTSVFGDAGFYVTTQDTIGNPFLVLDDGTNRTLLAISAKGRTILTAAQQPGSGRLILEPTGDVGVGTLDPQEAFHVRGGLIYSEDGGFKFPDGTVQTTAALGDGGDGHSLDTPSGSASDVVFVSDVAYVGVGTTGPTSPLHVVSGSSTVNVSRVDRQQAAAANADLLELKVLAGSSASTQLIEAEVGTNVVFRVWGDGDVSADGAFMPGGADFAELVRVGDDVSTVEAGDVLVIDPTAKRGFAKSRTARSPLVAGVHSTKPGVLGTETDWDGFERAGAEGETIARKAIDVAREHGEVPMAMVGIVPCKVSAENGRVKAGDLLVTSDTPGHAMRVDAPSSGTILGKALADMSGATDRILILVTLQ